MSLKRYIDALINERVRRLIRRKMRFDSVDSIKADIVTTQRTIDAVIKNPNFDLYKHEVKRVFARLNKICSDMLSAIKNGPPIPSSTGHAEYVSSREQQFRGTWKQNVIFREHKQNSLSDELASLATKATVILNQNKQEIIKTGINTTYIISMWTLLYKLFYKIYQDASNL